MNRVVGELDRKLDKNLVGMEEGRVVEKLHVLVKNSEEENRMKEDENEIARNHRRNLVVGGRGTRTCTWTGRWRRERWWTSLFLGRGRWEKT